MHDMSENTSLKKASQSDGNSKQRTKQVCISIHPERHQKLKEFAHEKGTNFSQLVREGAELVRYRHQNGGIPKEFHPLLQEIESVKEKIDETNQNLSDLTETVEEPGQDRSENYSESILELFYDGSQWTIPQIGKELSIAHEEVQSSLRILEDRHAIRRIEPDDGETEMTRWKMVGSQ